MKFPTAVVFGELQKSKAFGQTTATLALFLFLVLFSSPILKAQQTDAPSDSKQQSQDALLQRIAQLEARLKDVEAVLAKSQPGGPAAPAPVTAPAPSRRYQ